MIERAGQGCAIGDDLFDRLHQPYIREGQRTGAFRFGDPRAMALTGALWSAVLFPDRGLGCFVIEQLSCL